MTENNDRTLTLQSVDPAAMKVWRIQALAAALVVGVASAIPLAPISPLIGAIVLSIVAGGGLILALSWPKAYFRRLRYGLDEFGLILQQGVLWRTQIALPRSRIQHSDVAQGPLQRRYGIATLKLYTAGSRHTKIELPGLTHADAIALRDALLNRTPVSG